MNSENEKLQTLIRDIEIAFVQESDTVGAKIEAAKQYFTIQPRVCEKQVDDLFVAGLRDVYGGPALLPQENWEWIMRTTMRCKVLLGDERDYSELYAAFCRLNAMYLLRKGQKSDAGYELQRAFVFSVQAKSYVAARALALKTALVLERGDENSKKSSLIYLDMATSLAVNLDDEKDTVELLIELGDVAFRGNNVLSAYLAYSIAESYGLPDFKHVICLKLARAYYRVDYFYKAIEEFEKFIDLILHRDLTALCYHFEAGLALLNAEKYEEAKIRFHIAKYLLSHMSGDKEPVRLTDSDKEKKYLVIFDGTVDEKMLVEPDQPIAHLSLPIILAHIAITFYHIDDFEKGDEMLKDAEEALAGTDDYSYCVLAKIEALLVKKDYEALRKYYEEYGHYLRKDTTFQHLKGIYKVTEALRQHCDTTTLNARKILATIEEIHLYAQRHEHLFLSKELGEEITFWQEIVNGGKSNKKIEAAEVRRLTISLSLIEKYGLGFEHAKKMCEKRKKYTAALRAKYKFESPSPNVYPNIIDPLPAKEIKDAVVVSVQMKGLQSSLSTLEYGDEFLAAALVNEFSTTAVAQYGGMVVHVTMNEMLFLFQDAQKMITDTNLSGLYIAAQFSVHFIEFMNKILAEFPFKRKKPKCLVSAGISLGTVTLARLETEQFTRYDLIGAAVAEARTLAVYSQDKEVLLPLNYRPLLESLIVERERYLKKGEERRKEEDFTELELRLEDKDKPNLNKMTLTHIYPKNLIYDLSEEQMDWMTDKYRVKRGTYFGV